MDLFFSQEEIKAIQVLETMILDPTTEKMFPCFLNTQGIEFLLESELAKKSLSSKDGCKKSIGEHTEGVFQNRPSIWLDYNKGFQ